MQQSDLPIGFYDSGVGGVSVLRQAALLLPNENFIYFGDMANAPYGTKSEDEIKSCSLASGEFLFQKGVKAIVIACNTATSIVVTTMREEYKVPVISIEPAIKPAMQASADGYILVLATPATLRQQRYETLVTRLGAGGRVRNIPCEGLADMIENRPDDKKAIEKYLVDKFRPYRNTVVSGVVIGCTHYSFISDSIEHTANACFAGNIKVFDGMFGTARHLVHVLESSGLRSNSQAPGCISFYSSAPDQQAAIEKLQNFFRNY